MVEAGLLVTGEDVQVPYRPLPRPGHVPDRRPARARRRLRRPRDERRRAGEIPQLAGHAALQQGPAALQSSPRPQARPRQRHDRRRRGLCRRHRADRSPGFRTPSRPSAPRSPRTSSRCSGGWRTSRSSASTATRPAAAPPIGPSTSPCRTSAPASPCASRSSPKARTRTISPGRAAPRRSSACSRRRGPSWTCSGPARPRLAPSTRPSAGRPSSGACARACRAIRDETLKRYYREEIEGRLAGLSPDPRAEPLRPPGRRPVPAARTRRTAMPTTPSARAQHQPAARPQRALCRRRRGQPARGDDRRRVPPPPAPPPRSRRDPGRARPRGPQRPALRGLLLDMAAAGEADDPAVLEARLERAGLRRGGGPAHGPRQAAGRPLGRSIRMPIRCDLKTHCGRRSPCIGGRARYIANFGPPSAPSRKRTTRPISPGCERSRTNCPRWRVRRPTGTTSSSVAKPDARASLQRAGPDAVQVEAGRSGKGLRVSRAESASEGHKRRRGTPQVRTRRTVVPIRRRCGRASE